MKKHLAPLLASLAWAVALPALAGPDFEVIEAGRLAAQKASQDKAGQVAGYASGADGSRQREMPPRPPKPAVATARPSP